MPSPRPSAGSPLRGRLRRGLQEEKSPRRNMLRGPSTSAAPATGPHLRLPSSPPPGFPAPVCGFVAPPPPVPATALRRATPVALTMGHPAPGCLRHPPPRPRHQPTATGASRCHATPAQRHRQTPQLVKQPRLRRRRDRSSVTCRRWAIPTPVHVRHPADRPDAPQTAALRQATAPPIGRHSSRPPAPPNATIQPPVTVQRFTLRHRNTPRFAGAVFTREERRGAAITIHSPASSRSLGSTS